MICTIRMGCSDGAETYFPSSSVFYLENSYSSLFHLCSVVTSLWISQGAFQQFHTIFKRSMNLFLNSESMGECGILKWRLFIGTAWLRSCIHSQLVSLSSDLRPCCWFYSPKKCQGEPVCAWRCYSHSICSIDMLREHVNSHCYRCSENKRGKSAHLIATANHLP